MLYLAAHFVWFLLAAFAMGCVIGWLSGDAGKPTLALRALGYTAAAWLGFAALSWLRTFNGSSALWLETALLFVAAYFAGCVLGDITRARAAVAAAEPVPAGIATGSTMPEPALAQTPADNIAIAGPPEAEAAKPAETIDQKGLPGVKPEILSVARNESPDDLKIIKGIGPQNEQKLHALGIWHFDQIAGWTADNAEWVGGYMAFPGRIERENWIEQAQALAAAKKPQD